MQKVSKGRLAILAAVGVCLGGITAPLTASAEPTHHHYLRHHDLHHRGHHLLHVAHFRANRPAVVPVAYFSSSNHGPTTAGVSAAVINVQSGQIVSSYGADIPRYPASLTKLMTLDLAFQELASGRLSLDTQIPVSEAASSVEPVKLGLRPGSTIAVGDAIMAMTTMSANDAATALGQYLGGGSLTRCAQMMTDRAHALGMAQTDFANPSGLPNPYQVSTAHDLALLARDIVLQYPQYQHFFEIKSFDFRGRTIYSNNGMLTLYPGTTGMKTGYTDLARHNLITSAERGGQALVGVVLHEPSWGTAYTQMSELLNNGFYGHNTTVAQATPSAPVQPTAPIVRVANRDLTRAHDLPNSDSHQRPVSQQWAAQLGTYTYKLDARYAALKAHRLSGAGIAQIRHIQQNGKTVWLAQLTGMTYSNARSTCSNLHAHDGRCSVQRLYANHLA